MINILDFGADPTRSSGSHAAIQNAVDAADSLGHGVVSFPPGDYLVRDTIKVPSGVTLVGEGSRGNGFNTRITCDTELDALVSFHQSHTAGLCGLYLDGDYKARRVVQATDTWGLRISQCYIRKPRQDGTGAGLWGGALLYPDIIDTIFGTILHARGIDIIEANYEDAGYYGANVGTIQRCQIHSRMASIKFSGQILIADNDIEGSLYEDLAVIELGDHSHGHITIRGNYFEVRPGDGHQLRGIACAAAPGGVRITNNIMYGDVSAPDSIAIDSRPYCYPLIIRDNSILRWHTGIYAAGPSRRTVILGPNSFSHVPNEYGNPQFAPGANQNSYQGLRYQIIGTGATYSEDPFIGNADGGMCEVHAWTRHVRPQDTVIDLQSGRNFVVDLPDCPEMTYSNELPGMEFLIHFKQAARFNGSQNPADKIVRYIVDADNQIRILS